MIALQNCKIVASGLLTAATNATATSLAIDTRGYKYATVMLVGVPASAATASSHWTSITLQQGDTTSSYADVSGFVSGTDYTITGNASTSDPYIAKFDVDLRGKKRYLNVKRQAADSTLDDHRIVAILHRGDEAPDSVSEAGIINWVKG